MVGSLNLTRNWMAILGGKYVPAKLYVDGEMDIMLLKLERHYEQGY